MGNYRVKGIFSCKKNYFDSSKVSIMLTTNPKHYNPKNTSNIIMEELHIVVSV